MNSGGERSTGETLDEKSITIGSQIGGSESETPTPVGRAGSLSGSAHTGSPILINDVHSKDFESKIDDFFTSKTKVKDHGTRAASIKIGGQWT
jgi:hypothetical protein